MNKIHSEEYRNKLQEFYLAEIIFKRKQIDGL